MNRKLDYLTQMLMIVTMVKVLEMPNTEVALARRIRLAPRSIVSRWTVSDVTNASARRNPQCVNVPSQGIHGSRYVTRNARRPSASMGSGHRP